MTGHGYALGEEAWEDRQLERRARKFAEVAHAGQLYGEEFPYIVHLEKAVAVLKDFGVSDSQLICAEWLHDVLEDNTNVSYDEVASLFGEIVADWVNTLTEPSGKTRKERHTESYPKIRRRTETIVMKLGDRIAHVSMGGKKVRMYRKEHPEFKRALYREIPNGYEVVGLRKVELEMWEHLDDLIARVSVSRTA